MARRKQLVVSSEVKLAKRLRPCHHNKKGHQIKKGEVVLEVRHGMGTKGYCLPCAREMLTAAEETLQGLRADLARFLPA